MPTEVAGIATLKESDETHRFSQPPGTHKCDSLWEVSTHCTCKKEKKHNFYKNASSKKKTR
jgi:DNA polymerase III delta prime subunit